MAGSWLHSLGQKSALVEVTKKKKKRRNVEKEEKYLQKTSD